MASEFELIAALIDEDRFFMEVDEYGFGNLLKDILRTCHDLNSHKYDAADLGGVIASMIAGYVGVKPWPEEEGSGFSDWDQLDLPDTVPSRQPDDTEGE